MPRPVLAGYIRAIQCVCVQRPYNNNSQLRCDDSRSTHRLKIQKLFFFFSKLSTRTGQKEKKRKTKLAKINKHRDSSSLAIHPVIIVNKCGIVSREMRKASGKPDSKILLSSAEETHTHRHQHKKTQLRDVTTDKNDFFESRPATYLAWWAWISIPGRGFHV